MKTILTHIFGQHIAWGEGEALGNEEETLLEENKHKTNVQVPSKS